jgi:hypothetical protein
MADREIIHCTADVANALYFVLDNGFQVAQDLPSEVPEPQMLTRSKVGGIQKGVFLVFRPEWLFGPFQFMAISDGANQGKFFLQPRVNYSAITLYFGGERVEKGQRMLGSGAVSFYREWLELPAKVLKPAPDDGPAWFKKIIAQLSAGIVIKAGKHRYEICRGVIADPSSAQCLPPFEFIPWNKELFA